MIFLFFILFIFPLFYLFKTTTRRKEQKKLLLVDRTNIRFIVSFLNFFCPRFVLNAAWVRSSTLKNLNNLEKEFHDHVDKQNRKGILMLLEDVERKEQEYWKKGRRRLNLWGRIVLKTQLDNATKKRYIFEQLWRTFPEIEQEKILDPIFIVGLPRTGSTRLQRLFQKDEENFQSITYWEINKLHNPNSSILTSKSIENRKNKCKKEVKKKNKGRAVYHIN